MLATNSIFKTHICHANEVCSLVNSISPMSIPGLVMYCGYIRYCHWGNLGRIHRDLPRYFYSFVVNLKLLQNKKLNIPRECRPNFNQPPVFSLKCVDIPWPSPDGLVGSHALQSKWDKDLQTWCETHLESTQLLTSWPNLFPGDDTCYRFNSLDSCPWSLIQIFEIKSPWHHTTPTNSYAFCTDSSYLMNREPDLQFSHSVVNYTGQINCIKNMSQDNDFTSS